uniref:Metallophos domain-containing protein n=1 Tax=Caenorhabditis tropicalis TaxID=1561998 RepID=A0A1I7V052_9PELO
MGYNKLFPKSVIICAGSTSKGNIPLVFIDRNVKINSDVYQKLVLMDVSRPWVTSQLGQQHFILQQDPAPVPWPEIQESCSRRSFPWLLVHGHVARFLTQYESTRLFRLGIFRGQGNGSISPKSGVIEGPLLKEWEDLDDDYPRRTASFCPSRLRAWIKAKGSNIENLF